MFVEGNDLDIILFSEAKNYKKYVESMLTQDRKPRYLFGAFSTKDNRMECYIDNIAISRYDNLVKRNGELIDFMVRSDNPSLKENLDKYIDSEMFDSISREIDKTVLHELTHKFSGYQHPSIFRKLVEKERENHLQNCENALLQQDLLTENNYDNEKTKEILLVLGLQTYTTKNFDAFIGKAIDWYNGD